MQIVLIVCAAAAAGAAACLAAGKACEMFSSSGSGTSRFFSVPAEDLLKSARSLPR